MVIRAALPLIAERGAAVTTQQVARAAGIGEATIFRVFPDKDALLDACVAAWLADAEAQYPPQLPSGHGFLAHRGIAAAARAAIDGVILPGLEHLQLDAAPARRWAAQSLASSDTAADPVD